MFPWMAGPVGSMASVDVSVVVPRMTHGFVLHPVGFRRSDCNMVVMLVGCLTSQQHVSVSQGRICSDNFMYCHTEIEVADPTFYLTQS